MAQMNFGILNTELPAQIGAAPANAFLAYQQARQQGEDRAFAREGQQMQNALARMQMGKAQADMDEETAFKGALRGANGDYKGAMPSLMAASPTRALSLQKQIAEQEKAGREATKADLDATMKRFEIIDRTAGQFAANPTRETAVWVIQQMAANGTAPEVIAQMSERLNAASDAELPQMAQQFLAATQEGIKAQTARLFPAPSEFEKTTQLAGLTPEQTQAAARQKLTKDTTHAPASVTNVNMALEREEQKAKGKANVEAYGEIRNGAAVARKLNAQLDSQLRTLETGFKTGFGTEWKAAAANALGALGVQDAEKYATNAQTFKAAAIEVVLQKQLAQKGPQTESDAKRIQETGTQLGNTVDANRFIIDIARAQNDRDIAQQQFFDKYWRQNGTYEGAEAAWYGGEGGKSLFESSRLSKYGKPKGAAPAGGGVQFLGFE